MSKKEDLGKFMAEIAMKADAATKASIDKFRKELEEQKQEEILQRLREVYNLIDRQVDSVRSLRAREKAHLAEIRRLKAMANEIVAGKA